jgi:hypothetical protein
VPWPNRRSREHQSRSNVRADCGSFHRRVSAPDPGTAMPLACKAPSIHRRTPATGTTELEVRELKPRLHQRPFRNLPGRGSLADVPLGRRRRLETTSNREVWPGRRHSNSRPPASRAVFSPQSIPPVFNCLTFQTVAAVLLRHVERFGSRTPRQLQNHLQRPPAFSSRR